LEGSLLQTLADIYYTGRYAEYFRFNSSGEAVDIRMQIHHQSIECQ
jgi:hypothetical protein